MKLIARNPIIILGGLTQRTYQSGVTLVIFLRQIILKVFLLSVLLFLFGLLTRSGYLLADTIIQLPTFSEYNRGVNWGSEISRDVKYQGKPTDKLLVGVKSPLENSWESHSTVTTSLFPIAASVRKTLYFQVLSYGLQQKQSVLWFEIHYFDQHGVLIDTTGGETIDVPSQWTEASIALAPAKLNTAYAEVWFVKYQDADETGETIHPIYLSGIGIR